MIFIATSFDPAIFARELATVFLFWEKAIFASSKNRFSSITFFLKKSEEMPLIFIIAESTFGFGQKQEDGTLDIILGFA